MQNYELYHIHNLQNVRKLACFAKIHVLQGAAGELCLPRLRLPQRFSILSCKFSFLFLSHEGISFSFLSCKRKKRNKERLPAASPEAKKFFQLLRRKNSCFALKQFAPLNALSSTFLNASSAKAGHLMII